MTKLLICGGRDFVWSSFAEWKLDTFHHFNPVSLVIEGGAKGADTIGRQWADSRNIPVQTFKADWNTHGNSADPIRNAQMLQDGQPNSVIAFDGGRGTDHMVSIAEKAEVTVHRFRVKTKDYVYDIESYPNFFSCVVRHIASRQRWVFEVSDWQNDARAFCEFMNALSFHDCRMIGFNNFYYDWQVIEHCLAIGPEFTAYDAFQKTEQIINGCGYCWKCKNGNSYRCETNFKSTVWGSNQKVKQIDLYLIHHFDNKAKSTSLKETEFNMRSSNVGDLPIKPGSYLTYEDRKGMLKYNAHDVDETERFAEFSEPMINFREELIESMGYDVMNYNDTKIGKKFFEQELKSRAPHLLGTYSNKKQTKREVIHLKDVIIPKIEFETPELKRVLTHLQNTSITKTKDPPELNDLHATLRGFTMDVGAGGGHGSVERQCVRPESGWKLLDVDVASYYPNLAIANRFFPAHLSETFCDIYQDVYERRKGTAKNSPANAMYKLALNGVYGDSANEFSIFLDPQYTMQITINGQLLLYLLTEKMIMHTRAKMVQLNTDGITFLIPENEENIARDLCAWWESFTGLTLEFAEYEAMWIRDVNNYIAKKTNGSVKRIGAYAFETQRENPGTREVTWGKDHSALVVQKAACAAMIDGVPVREFIYNHTDAFDFMLRSKATGKTRQRLFPEGSVDTPPFPETYVADDGNTYEKTSVDSKGTVIRHMVFRPDGGQWLQKLTRYYIAKNGAPLQMIYQPAPAATMKQKERIIGQNVGWNVAVCDDIKDFDPKNIDYEWYVTEAEKLVIR